MQATTWSTRRVVSALIAVILSWAAPAHAAAPAPARQGLHDPSPFSVYDTNRDGYLNREEYQTFLDRMRAHRAAHGKGPHRSPELLGFDAIDKNRDGRISEAELVAALSHRMKGWRHRARYGQMRREQAQAEKPAQGSRLGQPRGPAPAPSHPE